LAPNLRQLQHFVRRLESLEQMRTSELNRLAKISEEDETRAFIEEMIAHVERQMADIERRIRDLIDDDSDLRAKRQLLLSIPGIGERTVAALLGEIPNMNEFRSGKAVGAFAGLSPRQFQSGAYSGQTRLSKIGNVHVRRAMYMPALCAIRWNHILQAFAARLRARGKSPKAIVAAVMRRLLVIAYGVLKSGRQFDPRRIAA
jgi:transposase